MDTTKIIAEIEQLAEMYKISGNRMVLTTLRQLTTKILKQSGGCLNCKLFDAVANYFDPRLIGLKEL